MAEALKACPFDGATPHRGPAKVRHGQDGEAFQRYRVWCPHGCAQIDGMTEDQAVEQWNRRASPIPPADMREQVARIIEDLIMNAARISVGGDRSSVAGRVASGLECAALRDPAIDAILALDPPAVGVAEPVGWRDMKDAPKDGSDIILNHKVHGIIQARFWRGEWSDDTPNGPAEYDGDMWVLGDDLAREEVEFGPDGWEHHGNALGWLPAAPDGEVERLSYELDKVSMALGSDVRFMDPPDGGDVTLGEQVARMRAALSAAEAKLQAMEEERALDRESEDRIRELEAALRPLLAACRSADAAEDLSDFIDGSLLDAAEAASYPTIWTDDQVKVLEARQANGMMHPYTCGNDRSDALHTAQAAEDGEEHQPGKLVPTRQGWVCPACSYRQFWSHETGLPTQTTDGE